MNPEPAAFELARRAREGDQEALAKLLEQERLPLFTLAFAQLRHYDDAQDVVAATMLQVCLHVRELREPESVRSWMQTIIRNEVRMCRRRSVPAASVLRLEDLASTETEAPGTSSTSTYLPALLLRLDVLQALLRLPWDEARAVSLFYLAGLPIREIAQHLDRPEGTVKRWLHLGRHHLAAEMEAYAPGSSIGNDPVCREADERHETGCIQ